MQEYFPDVPLTSPKKIDQENATGTPRLHTLGSIDILETLAQNHFWNFEYKNFNFNILELHEIGDQFQLTMKVLLTNENKAKFSVSMIKFYEFWQELRRKYEKRQNCFHNFEHGLNGKKKNYF